MLQLFTFTGRLRRRDFFWRVPILYLVAFICYGVAAQQINDPTASELGVASAKWLTLVLLALCGYLIITQSVKRLHDLNLNGLWLLFAVVPVANFVLGSAMQFRPGTTGPNQYGPDPKQLQEVVLTA